jgi:hypothetical protein
MAFAVNISACVASALTGPWALVAVGRVGHLNCKFDSEALKKIFLTSNGIC